MSDMTTLGRLVVRDSENENDGLMLGFRFKAGKEFFKNGHVYEIQDVFGEVLIKDLGESWVPRTVTDRSKAPPEMTTDWPGCWGNEAGWLLTCVGKYLFLTLKEYLHECTRSEPR